MSTTSSLSLPPLKGARVRPEQSLRIRSIALVGSDRRFGAETARQVGLVDPRAQVDLYASAEEARAAMVRRTPEVVVTDLELPGSDGISLIRSLKPLYPATCFLLVAAVEQPETIFRALEAGARGYLLKSLTPSEFLEAVAEALRGGVALPGRVAQVMVEHLHRRGAMQCDEDWLTPRESQILELLCVGYRAKEVGSRLGISVQTVNSHVRHLYIKLRVTSRAEAVAKHLGRRVSTFPGAVG